jgi:hypothetical protein
MIVRNRAILRWSPRILSLLFAVALLLHVSVTIARLPIISYEFALSRLKVGDDAGRVTELLGPPHGERLLPNGYQVMEYHAFPLFCEKEYGLRKKWRVTVVANRVVGKQQVDGFGC